MVTRPRKVLSILLASTMIASMCILPTSVSAADIDVEGSETAALASHYKTNPSGKGAKKTITIDGDASDWSEDLLIAQGAAWDVANHWKGGHENCVLDTYALFGAWDDQNLYIGWQMVNTTDTWANPGDGPLSDGGRVLDVPLILALSLDEGSTSMSNKNTSGTAIWGQKMGLQFDTHVDRLLYMSGKPGLGKPSMFKAVDAQGNTDYDDGCVGFADGGIEYKMATTNICSTIIGLDGSESPNDVCDDSADWVDFKTKNHDTKYDSFYEIKIPLATLGITSSHIESNGVGAMLVATRGESALDCIPYDLSMVDNATGDYSADPSTSLEKEDTDIITATLARIGNSGGVVIPTSKPTSKPTTSPSNPTTATTATSAPSTGVTGTKSVTVAKGDTVTFTVKATSSTKKLTAYRMTTDYPSDAFSIDTSYSSDGVNTPGASSGQEVVNTGTAGKIQTAVLANSNYDISSAKALQTVKFKAKKAGTFKITYTMNEMLDTSSKDLATNGKVNSAVTMSVSASVTQAAVVTTGSTTATFAAGDTVTVNVSLKTAKELYGFRTDLTYDSALLTVKSVTFPNFSGGTTLANTDTAGKISTTGVGTPTKTYDFTTSKNLVRVTFTAKKAGSSSKITYLMKEVIGLDAVNQFDESTGKSIVSTTTSTISAKTTTPSSNIGSTSQSITVTKGQVVTYVSKVKTSTKFKKYVLTTKYDSAAFGLYTSFSSDGVNTLKATQGGTESVDTATAGTVKATVTAASGSPYTASSATNLVIVKFTAKKAGTFTISSTLDSMTNSSGTAMTGSQVTFTSSVSAVTPSIASTSQSITVTKGQVVTYVSKVKTSTKFKKYVLTTKYDSAAFGLYTSFSSDGVNTLKATQGGTESVDTATAGTVKATVTAASGSPYTASSATNLVIVKFTAKKAGTFTISSTLDSMTNSSGTAMTGSQVTFTSSVSAITPALASTSQSVKVAKGQVVTYTAKVKTSVKFSKYVTTVKYDSAAFSLYTDYSTDGVNTIKAAQGGKETVDTATAGTITATVTAGANSPYTASTATNIIIVKFKAKKAGTFTVSSTLDSMTNESGKAMTSSQITLTSSSSVITPDTGKVAGVSRSIQVKQGEVIVYTVKAKTASKFKSYKITTTYDSSALELYTGYSTDGVTTLKLNQGGTESVNTATAGKVVATATCASGTPYKATSATNLQIIKFKAKKAGTYTIGGVVNSMTNSSGTAMTSNDVTISNTASVVIPFTESKSVTVTKGQYVNYYVTVTLPNTGYDISGWAVDMYYDTNLFEVNKSFANNKGFAVGNAAVNYATGATTTSATLPGGKVATANFNTAGTVTILDANSSGLGLKGKTTKLVCIQLKAKKAGTGVLAYSVKNFVGTNGTTKYINAKYQAVNGATFAMTAQKK